MRDKGSGGMGSTIAPPRFVAFCVLLIAGIALAWRWLQPTHAIMAGFDVAAGIFLLSLLPLLRHRDADDMRKAAKANDANRVLLLAVSTSVVIAILVAVAAELGGGKARGSAVAMIIGTLALAWLFSNCVYALHYAHLYYLADATDGNDQGGLDVPGAKEPGYDDFVYFAFTLGMTFQTSDIAITQPHMRRIATMHCLAAFVFNIGVLAFTVNVLGS